MRLRVLVQEHLVSYAFFCAFFCVYAFFCVHEKMRAGRWKWLEEVQ